MEATGRDGDRGPSWSYRRHWETGSITSYDTTTSSRSGTIVSTVSVEEAIHFLSLGIDGDWEEAEEERIKRLFQEEFFRKPSENRRILGSGVLETWFSKLGVRWVLLLHVADYASAWVHEPPTTYEIWSWIRALTQIMETIRLTESFFPDHGHGFVDMPGISEEEVELPPESRKQATSLDPVQFALFFKEAMSKMLVFVDVMFSKSISIRGSPDTSVSLVSCLNVHSALSRVLLGIRLKFHSSPPAEVERIENEMVSLLSAKQGKAFEGIWSTLEEIRTRILSMVDSSGTQTPQGSSNIHEATYSVMSHINFLLDNPYTITPLVSQAVSLGKYVLQIGEAPPLICLITDMVSCLEEKLITNSQLFRDKGLGLLFLLNNSNFIREKLMCSYIKVDAAAVTHNVDHYIDSYIQVSWGPVLSCLCNHTLCLGRNYSPLSKFESEFHKIYTTQKLWKLPDPELRKRLRKAVIEKIIPGYTKYIEDSKVTNPKFTPHELEDMLQELFEG